MAIESIDRPVSIVQNIFCVFLPIWLQYSCKLPPSGGGCLLSSIAIVLSFDFSRSLPLPLPEQQRANQGYDEQVLAFAGFPVIYVE